MTNKIAPTAKQHLLWISMILVTLDSASIVMTYPVIPDLLLDSHSTFFANITHTSGFFHYSISSAIYFLGIVIGSTLVSGLSDKFGRLNVLTIAIIGTILGQLCLMTSIDQHHIALLYLSRLCIGLFGITCPLSQAIALDISNSSEDRFKQLNWITLAYSIGMILGPALIPIMAKINPEWSSHTNIIMAASILCRINLLICLYYRKHERQPNTNHIPKQRLWKNIQMIKTTLFFIFMNELAYGLFVHNVPAILIERYHINLSDNSHFYLILGITHIIGVLAFNYEKIPLKSKTNMLFLCITLSAVSYGLSSTASISMIIITTSLIGFLQVPICNILLEKASRQSISDQHNGQVMGICNTTAFLSYTSASILSIVFEKASTMSLVLCMIIMAFLAMSLYKSIERKIAPAT